MFCNWGGGVPEASRVNLKAVGCHPGKQFLCWKRLWLLGQEDRWLRHSRSLQYGIVDGGVEIPVVHICIEKANAIQTADGVSWSLKSSLGYYSRMSVCSRRIGSDSTAGFSSSENNDGPGGLKFYQVNGLRPLGIWLERVSRLPSPFIICLRSLFHLFSANLSLG